MPGFTSAEYYEILTNSEERLRKEGPFLLTLLKQAPGVRALDLACGTGLHAKFLAGHGCEVDAVDAGEEMIAYASEKRADDRIHYRVEDMRELTGGPWDLAICLGNSLCLLETGDALREVFRRVAEGLAPDGYFVSQILNYARPLAQEPRHRVEHRDVDGAHVVAVKSLVPDRGRTLLSVAYFARRGDVIDRHCDTAVLAEWRPEDLRAAAETAGLRVYAVHGGLDGADFDPAGSADVVLVAAKPG